MLPHAKREIKQIPEVKEFATQYNDGMEKKRRSEASLPSGRRKHAIFVFASVVFFVACLAVAVRYTNPTRDGEDLNKQNSPNGNKSLSLSAISGVDHRKYATSGLQPILEQESATTSDWKTEVYAEQAGNQLSRLSKLIQRESQVTTNDVRSLAAADFRCSPLHPELELVHVGPAVRILRQSGSSRSNASRGSGLELLAREIDELRSSLGDAEVKFKTFRIQENGGSFKTHSYYLASNQPSTIQQNATWICEWNIHDGDAPMLTDITVTEFEEVCPGDRGRIRFEDWTQSVLGANDSFHDLLRFGMDHWRNRLSRYFDLDFTGHHGIAVGDVNGDLLDDLYFCQPGGLPNRLYVRQRGGTLRDMSSESGADWLDMTHGASLIDLDNDGDQDLVLTQPRRILIMENDGDGHFRRRFRANGPGLYFSIAAADFDNDTDLDLFICGYSVSGVIGRNSSEHTVPTPYHDANNGVSNILFRNDGNWNFVDVTREVGLDANNRRFSFAASWEDFDNDGDLDLYVANDFGRNNLYHFESASNRFTDIAGTAGVEDISAGMSITWGDYNRDGFMDAYISNMFSSAGGRVAYQRQFRHGSDATILSSYQRHARGNSLFDNQSDGTFADVSEASKVTMARWAWGAKFADINNDQWDDLYVANGFITTNDTDDL